MKKLIWLTLCCLSTVPMAYSASAGVGSTCNQGPTTFTQKGKLGNSDQKHVAYVRDRNSRAQRFENAVSYNDKRATHAPLNYADCHTPTCSPGVYECPYNPCCECAPCDPCQTNWEPCNSCNSCNTCNPCPPSCPPPCPPACCNPCNNCNNCPQPCYSSCNSCNSCNSCPQPCYSSCNPCPQPCCSKPCPCNPCNCNPCNCNPCNCAPSCAPSCQPCNTCCNCNPCGPSHYTINCQTPCTINICLPGGCAPCGSCSIGYCDPCCPMPCGSDVYPPINARVYEGGQTAPQAAPQKNGDQAAAADAATDNTPKAQTRTLRRP